MSVDDVHKASEGLLLLKKAEAPLMKVPTLRLRVLRVQIDTLSSGGSLRSKTFFDEYSKQENLDRQRRLSV